MKYFEAMKALEEAKNTLDNGKTILRNLLPYMADNIDNLGYLNYEQQKSLKTIKRKLKKFDSRDGRWLE